MTFGLNLVASQSSSQTEKTKAKQRYLRRKKERRKQKKQPSKKNVRNGDEESEGDNSISATSENGEPEEIPKEIVLELPTKTRKDVKLPQPPSKKQKMDLEADEVEDVEMGDEPTDTRRAPQPISTEALPSFPAPAPPPAPSKSELSRQGLDQALIDATLVASTTLLEIPAAGDQDGGTGLSEKMRKRLKDLGITELFAVQTTLLPFLLPSNPLKRALYLPYDPPRDVCVSAPTGSGKTLAYVLPIVELLSARIVTRLRALVVLPTRDLVNQVRETFEAISKGRGLKIGIATGQHSFAHEQSQLVLDISPGLLGGSSKVDILICTPGRLIDHINGTTNFSLQHLRFLVIDEADRLLAQSFHDWLAQVLSSTRPTTFVHTPSSENASRVELAPSSLPIPDAVAPSCSSLLPHPTVPPFFSQHKESSCQKLLFSATLTRDPGKIAALNLRDPKYVIVQGNAGEGEMDITLDSFAMPDTLTERMVVCDPANKPLVFFYLVHIHNVTNALVFTKSAESTTRLMKLFEFFQTSRTLKDKSQTPLIAQSYSSDLPNNERKSILEKFKTQEIQILVCSDLISRGIDISHVSHVVSYDAPVDVHKYVHRVGRTARAGRAGDAWTLVEEQEARYFKNMLSEADHLKKVKRVKVTEDQLKPYNADYEIALKKLKDVYTR